MLKKKKKGCKLLSGKTLSAKVCFAPGATPIPAVRRYLKTGVRTRAGVLGEGGVSDQRAALTDDLWGDPLAPVLPTKGCHHWTPRGKAQATSLRENGKACHLAATTASPPEQKSAPAEHDASRTEVRRRCMPS